MAKRTRRPPRTRPSDPARPLAALVEAEQEVAAEVAREEAFDEAAGEALDAAGVRRRRTIEPDPGKVRVPAEPARTGAPTDARRRRTGSSRPPADETAGLQAWLRRHAQRTRPPEPPAARVERSRPLGPPRFWEDFELAWTKLVLVRLVFFGLLAADAFLALAHTARHGAGGFDVPQLSWLPLGSPGRVAMITLHGALALAFALIAQGVALRVLLPAATALYAYAYFASQLDSYQHHYLVALLLLLWCFVPRAPEAGADGRQRVVRSWALRLMLVQLAIVYLWAAVAKLDDLWLDGSALRAQIASGWVRDLVGWIAFDTVAWLIVFVELGLAATLWRPRLWWEALPLGVGLHVGIELIGLEIGLFSYLMLALYLLLVPDRVFHTLDRLTRRAVGRLTRAPRAWLAVGASVALAGAGGFLALIPLPLGWSLALVVVPVVAVAVVTDAVDDRGRAGRTLAALGVAAGFATVLAITTDTVLDHHRYRAGAARRLGDAATARAAYQDILAIDPSSEYARHHLGNLEAAAGNVDAAIAHYRVAQRAAPLVARSFTAEARLAFARGELARAQAILRDALAADPEDAEALELVRSWSKLTPAEGPGAADGR